MPTGSPEQGYAFKKGGRGKGYEQQQMRSSRGKAATHATAAAAHAHSRGDHRRLVRTSMTRCCAATISACGRETCAAKQPTVARRSPRTGRPALRDSCEAAEHATAAAERRSDRRGSRPAQAGSHEKDGRWAQCRAARGECGPAAACRMGRAPPRGGRSAARHRHRRAQTAQARQPPKANSHVPLLANARQKRAGACRHGMPTGTHLLAVRCDAVGPFDSVQQRQQVARVSCRRPQLAIPARAPHTIGAPASRFSRRERAAETPTRTSCSTLSRSLIRHACD
jgi:hypothetical protein